MTARNYSYQGQDRFVLDMIGEKRGGFFLDSGASNGTSGSNSRLFEEAYGWSGICVEPNSAMFAELAATRSCICLNCCLHVDDRDVAFVESAGVYGGIVDYYDPQHRRWLRHAVPHLPPEGEPLPTVRKAARTLRSILDEHRAPAVIDYWSLDTEGSELALLKSFPFDDYRVRVITVEHNHGPSRGPIRDFLESVGFVLTRELGIDDGYVFQERRPRQWRGRWRHGRRAGPAR